MERHLRLHSQPTPQQRLGFLGAEAPKRRFGKVGVRKGREKPFASIKRFVSPLQEH